MAGLDKIGADVEGALERVRVPGYVIDRSGIIRWMNAAAKKLRLLWLSCGDKDSLLTSSRAFHESLDEKKVPHVWHVDSGGHTWPVWRNDLYLIAQMLFRDKK